MALLTTPFVWKGLTLKNRLVLPPMATAKADQNGQVTEELLAFYKEKTGSKQVGLVILEHSYVNRNGRVRDEQPSLAGDGAVSGMAKLVEGIHQNGAAVVAQINHGGALAVGEAIAPSAVRHPRAKNDALPREMSLADMAQLKADFAAAAARAKEAGFDGVEIHAAHGYLLNQFYSPLTNLRCDEYGGSLENRVRLIVEVIAAVRQAVGVEFPVAVRLGGCDYMDGGSTEEDAVQAAMLLEKAGADLLDLSGGMCGYVRAGHDEPGYFGSMTEKIKREVSVPVILTGGVKTAKGAEELLQEGKADLIGVGRAILADSVWPARELKTI